MNVLCPFCVGDGCCFCDHLGKIKIEEPRFKDSEDFIKKVWQIKTDPLYPSIMIKEKIQNT